MGPGARALAATHPLAPPSLPLLPGPEVTAEAPPAGAGSRPCKNLVVASGRGRRPRLWGRGPPRHSCRTGGPLQEGGVPGPPSPVGGGSRKGVSASPGQGGASSPGGWRRCPSSGGASWALGPRRGSWGRPGGPAQQPVLQGLPQRPEGPRAAGGPRRARPLPGSWLQSCETKEPRWVGSLPARWTPARPLASTGEGGPRPRPGGLAEDQWVAVATKNFIPG